MQEMVGGFARHEALWLRVAGVSEPHVVQFPRVVAGVVCVLAEVLAAGPFDWQCVKSWVLWRLV